MCPANVPLPVAPVKVNVRSRYCRDSILERELQGGGAPWRRHPRTCRSVSEQLRRELRKVVAPVDPCVTAWRFDEYGSEPVPLEEVDRCHCRRHQKVLLPSTEPQQPQPALQPRIVQFRRVLLFPGSGGRGHATGRWGRGGAASAAGERSKQSGAEHTDVREPLQSRNSYLQRLPASHRKARDG